MSHRPARKIAAKLINSPEVRAVTGDNVEIAWVDQGYTGERAAQAAKRHDITLEVVKLPETKRGFVLLPRRWVVERSFAWASKFRRLVKDYERYAQTLAAAIQSSSVMYENKPDVRSSDPRISASAAKRSESLKHASVERFSAAC